jgi:hypothetical protein
MNSRCSICDAVIAPNKAQDRCPECGARATFQTPTTESPRHAKSLGGQGRLEWEFSPDGPVLRRVH